MNKKWNLILEKEGLNNWKIIESKGGGLCSYKRKIIYILPNDFALLLHEIAHAKTYKWNKEMNSKTGHHSIWGDELTNLVRKYTIPHLPTN